jgi:hypothetical protein
MSSDQIKNSGVRLAKNIADDFKNQSSAGVSVSLGVTPDTNPYSGGTAPTSAATLRLTKIGNEFVVASWTGITGTAGAATKLGWASKLPAGYLPKFDKYAICSVTNASTVAAGVVTFETDGGITFATAANAAFTGSGTCAMHAGSAIYSLN